MFDTHCHLNDPVFKDDIEILIKDAKKAGVEFLLVPGIDIYSSQRAFQIAENYFNVYAAAGVHPTENLEDRDIDRTLTQLEELLSLSKRIVAVGEVGLDYHPLSHDLERSSPDTQREFFTQQIKLSSKMGKSLIIHNRNSSHDLLKILEKTFNSALYHHTVFHCCEPETQLLDFAKESSIFIGVDGDITYKDEKQKFVEQVPLEMMVLETDSPNLVPQPLRQQKERINKPANLQLIAREVARIKKLSVEEVTQITTENAKMLFYL